MSSVWAPGFDSGGELEEKGPSRGGIAGDHGGVQGDKGGLEGVQVTLGWGLWATIRSILE